MIHDVTVVRPASFDGGRIRKALSLINGELYVTEQIWLDYDVIVDNSAKYSDLNIFKDVDFVAYYTKEYCGMFSMKYLLEYDSLINNTVKNNCFIYIFKKYNPG